MFKLFCCTFTFVLTQVQMSHAAVHKKIVNGETIIIETKDNKPFFKDDERGWFFYEEPKVTIEKPKKKPKVVKTIPSPVSKTPKQKKLEAREIIKRQGDEQQNALARAILNPSPENYRDYLQKTNIIIAQSSKFADGLESYIYTAPEFDVNLNRLQSGENLQLFNREKNDLIDSNLAYIAQENALIFYFRSDCQYCHSYAPIVQRFSEKYGFSVLPISLDGKGLPEYPNPKYSQKLAEQMQVTVVPAIFLLNPVKNEITTVGFGISDFDELGKKVLAAFTLRMQHQKYQTSNSP